MEKEINEEPFKYYNIDEIKKILKNKESIASREPIISTYGEFLNKCNPFVREDIIDRLIKLQTNEVSVGNYKIMDEYTIESAKEEMMKDKKSKSKER